MKRFVHGRLGVGLAALALVAAACGGGGSEESTTKTFSVALTEPAHLNPGDSNESYGIQVIQSLFDRLTELDPKTGEPKMQQAESITSNDQKVWTIKLKPGLTFHNGEKVTAQSYVDAWNAAAYGPNGWANNYFFGNIEGYDALNPEDPDEDGPKEAPKPESDEMSGLKVTDESTFEVTLTAPLSQFPLTLAYTGFVALPKVAFDDFKKFDQAPIGNGPFQMDGVWQHNREIKLKRFAGYKGNRPAKAAGLVYKIYPNNDTAYTDLQAGKVDVLLTIPAAKVPSAKRDLGERFLDTPAGTMDFLAFPLYDKRFDDVNLRYAISMAIDREAITKAVYNGAYKSSKSLVAPIVPGFRDDPCGQHCTYDPTGAKALYDKAGGIDGPLELWFSNSDPTYRQWMEAVANQLKQNLGISEIKFRSIPAADYLTTLSEHKATGPYRQNWVMDYPSAENYLGPLYGRDGGSNRGGYSNPQVDALISKGNGAKSIRESITYYQQAEDLVLKDMPVTPLWNWRQQSGHSDNVSGILIDPYIQLHVDKVVVK
ncbi:MAG: ABC transporter substrate-binding protein [Streptosporangiales bacterium]|nr:ABC transporter substrate-binding protein [Streptosporangiales bacterium]